MRQSPTTPQSPEFEIVPPEERPARRGKGRPVSAWSLALAEGHTIFLPAKKHVSVSATSHLARLGLQVHQQRGERDGVTGLFVWVDRNGTESADPGRLASGPK